MCCILVSFEQFMLSNRFCLVHFFILSVVVFKREYSKVSQFSKTVVNYIYFKFSKGGNQLHFCVK